MSTEALQATVSLKVTKEADINETGEAIATDNAGEKMKGNDPVSALLSWWIATGSEEQKPEHPEKVTY